MFFSNILPFSSFGVLITFCCIFPGRKTRQVTNMLELMQRHAGRSLGPIQQHRIAMNEQFAVVEHSSPGFKDDAWWKVVGP